MSIARPGRLRISYSAIRQMNPRQTAMIGDFWSGSTISVSSISAARKFAAGPSLPSLFEP
jgi:hypothetical protein